MATTNFKRYTLFPIQYPSIFEFFEKQRDSFWVPKEVELEQDIKDWRSDQMTDDDRTVLTYMLAFFSQVDGMVLDYAGTNTSTNVDIDIPEVKIFYGIQAGIEAIHWEMYNLLIEALIDDPVEKDRAFNAVQNYPCIKQKAEWVNKWMSTDNTTLERLVAFACTEGIFFSSAFATIFYYKKRGLMPGLVLSNRFIARDEGLHRDAGCEIFKVLKTKFPDQHQISDERVLEIVEECVKIEENFVEDSLQTELIGLNADLMKQHVRFMADHLLQQLGMAKRYHSPEPFDWFELISMPGKQNFFEGRDADYHKYSGSTAFEMNSEW